MEIDATEDLDKMQRSMEDATGAGNDEDGNSGIQSLMTELTNSIPGIDEAMSFSELMKQVQNLDYDVVVFDTAPTGHTRKSLLSMVPVSVEFSVWAGALSCCALWSPKFDGCGWLCRH